MFWSWFKIFLVTISTLKDISVRLVQFQWEFWRFSARFLGANFKNDLECFQNFQVREFLRDVSRWLREGLQRFENSYFYSSYLRMWMTNFSMFEGMCHGDFSMFQGEFVDHSEIFWIFQEVVKTSERFSGVFE